MAEEIIPEGVRDFILQYIDSITQLEALLLLRANPVRAGLSPARQTGFTRASAMSSSCYRA